MATPGSTIWRPPKRDGRRPVPRRSAGRRRGSRRRAGPATGAAGAACAARTSSSTCSTKRRVPTATRLPSRAAAQRVARIGQAAARWPRAAAARRRRGATAKLRAHHLGGRRHVHHRAVEVGRPGCRRARRRAAPCSAGPVKLPLTVPLEAGADRPPATSIAANRSCRNAAIGCSRAVIGDLARGRSGSGRARCGNGARQPAHEHAAAAARGARIGRPRRCDRRRGAVIGAGRARPCQAASSSGRAGHGDAVERRRAAAWASARGSDSTGVSKHSGSISLRTMPAHVDRGDHARSGAWRHCACRWPSRSRRATPRVERELRHAAAHAHRLAQQVLELAARAAPRAAGRPARPGG